MKRNALFAACLLIALAISGCAGDGVKKNLTDKEILMLIYEQTNGANWPEKYRKNWGSDLPLSEWENVETDEQGRVTKLVLSNDSVKGCLPREIGGLTELKSLFVGLNNQMLPPMPDCFPAEIGELTKMEELELDVLSEKRVNMPPIGKMTALKELDLLGFSAYPDFTGLNELADVEMIGIDGALPPSLYTLPELKRLFIRTDNYTGGLTADIAKLKKLTFLLIDHTAGLVGSVDKPEMVLPAELFSMTSLEHLSLRAVTTSGTLPKEIGGMVNLKALWLSDLGLTGEIPPELFSLPKIKSIQVYSNKLTGSIPAEVGNCTTLGYLWPHKNQLTGTIPPTIGKLVNLETLQLNDNHLTGSIPAELGNCKKLGEGPFVDFSGNELSPDIPAAVKALPKFDKFKF